jgi:hypothetical protein
MLQSSRSSLARSLSLSLSRHANVSMQFGSSSVGDCRMLKGSRNNGGVGWTCPGSLLYLERWVSWRGRSFLWTFQLGTSRVGFPVTGTATGSFLGITG